MTDEQRVVSASRRIEAPATVIFELIADPARQPEWDGNANLDVAPDARRIRAVGDVFGMTLTTGALRENHVVEFDEARRIAWCPAEAGREPVGHLWRWELEPDGDATVVTHTYDWTNLHDPNRLPRARDTTEDKLRASVDRLAAIAESA
ncbi:SRPBCC family protein [Gordonia sp. CPCC 205515]|uniref:SRPBCC family protein n=1 Tax=Gordonia sp. CPCC 205515 TaxID=3140791 RepID=UPI003AF3BBF0